VNNVTTTPTGLTMRLRYLVLSTLAAISMGAPLAHGADNPTTTPAAGGSAGDNQGQQLITIETSDKPLEIVLTWISRRSQVNIVCNEVDQPRVTMRLINVTWQEAVQQIALKYDLVIEKKSDRIWNLTRPPKVRMEFQDARLGVVLEALARQANVNIVFADIDADKKITMTLNGVPWKEALDVIVKDAGLAVIEREYNIFQVVTTDKLQKDLVTKIYPLNYTKAVDMDKAIAGQLGEGGKSVVDLPSNSLVITATPPALEAITKVVASLDTRTRQVQIEMRFVDFSNADVQRIGFDPVNLNMNIANFGTLGGTFTPFNATPTATLGATRDLANIPTQTGQLSGAATFEAIATLSSTELLQSPSVLTLDNQEATIIIGRELHFAEETVTQDNGTTVRSLKEAQSSPVKDGIKILVTPHITSDGFVSITLSADNDDATLDTFTNKTNPDDPNASTIKLPTINQTQLKTTIMVQDGRTGVIGGLLRNNTIESEAHIPLLGDIPILGWMFRKTETTVEKRNLTIFITPRIVHMDDMGEFEKRREELRAKLSGIKPKPTTDAAQKPLNE
jgi:type IV pilus assembly protein PilQ